jgi:hypothetical protein
MYRTIHWYSVLEKHNIITTHLKHTDANGVQALA